MSAPYQPEEFVMLPRATHDFILQALRDASVALSRTHRLRATSHILLADGIRLTRDNSFEIDHLDQVLLMNLVEKLLARAGQPPGPLPVAAINRSACS
ncbi:hypothetical protein RAMLITH_01455 [Ramlibacter sp. RBP-2]|uniref:Uncharacterized protein n=1 Tax=Ramlibacter lithotrophicus TaxID=2606681 RepID=A0A7X6DC59_9BURK|nr:hypothetical protein [Ramlibacter lithotrophicus]NKE64474.1 hypothetical protein [Ramlibacter lithotrophicus]